MDEGTNGLPTDEEYRNVAQAFRDYLREAHDDDQNFGRSQYSIDFENLVPKIRRSAITGGLSGNEYDLRLGEAEKIVNDLAYALSANWRDKKEGWIWFKPTLNQLTCKSDTWDEASPVTTSYLDAATAAYLQRAWMQLNLLDWYILNGYVFDEAARLADGIKSGQAVGTINWAYLVADGDLEKTLY